VPDVGSISSGVSGDVTLVGVPVGEDAVDCGSLVRPGVAGAPSGLPPVSASRTRDSVPRSVPPRVVDGAGNDDRRCARAYLSKLEFA